MIDRKYVWFQGSEGSGKTTLIERLLKSSRSARWLVCRFREAPSPDLAGRWSYSDAEAEAYWEAGAESAAIYYLPKDQDGYESLYHSAFIEEYSDAIAFEGQDQPPLNIDLHVHVTRPLARDAELATFGEEVAARLDVLDYLRLQGVPIPKDARFLSEEEVREFDEEWEDEENGDEGAEDEIIEIPDAVAELLRAGAEEGIPIMKECWRLLPEHRLLPRAGLVVINIHDESERAEAEHTRRQIEALRARPDLRDDILGYRDRTRRVTIVVADLADRRDPELKKALARIKRVFRYA